MVTWDYINAKEGNFNTLKVNGEPIGNGNGEDENGGFSAGSENITPVENGNVNREDSQNLIITEGDGSNDIINIFPEGNDGDLLVLRGATGSNITIDDDPEGNIVGSTNGDFVRGSTLIWSDIEDKWVLLSYTSM